MKIRLMLVDKQRMLLEGLDALFSRKKNIRVVAKAQTAQDAIREARQVSPQVIITEVSLPDMNGLEAARRILAACPKTRIVILTTLSDRLTVARAFNIGVSGFMLKDSSFEELLQAVRSSMKGQIHLSPRVSGVVIEDYVKNLARRPALSSSTLTPREQEVLQLVAEGRSTKAVAATLQVSIKTANAHRKQIMNKMGFKSQVDLVKYCIREGLIHLDSP